MLKVTNLRLASHTARALYGTKHLPVLGREDPIRIEIIRRAHTSGPLGVRTIHHYYPGNLTSREMGVIWEDFKRDVQTYTRMCGIPKVLAGQVLPTTWGHIVPYSPLHTAIFHLEGEVQKAQDILKEITKKFIDLTSATHGLIITFQGIGWGDGGCLWGEIKVGGHNHLQRPGGGYSWAVPD